MKHTAAGAAAVIGVGALALFGAGGASADPGSVTFNDGGTQFTRTVSNVTPAVGDTITVDTAFYRLQAGDQTYWWFKDYHPDCLTYVPGTAKLTDAAGAHQSEPYLEIKPTFIAADFVAAGLQVVGKVGPGNTAPVFSAQYKVGACATGTSLTTGMGYNTNMGGINAQLSTKGPSITVGGTPGGGADSGSSSLTSLLGGLGSSK
ncbi:hypothetical protein [Nocardia sp. NPDC046763]|uniref:hypothetical protein n=1 Tax=Nocardia sp. NPDC046763 TaxID=3155256 RepID=UPI0034024DA0